MTVKTYSVSSYIKAYPRTVFLLFFISGEGGGRKKKTCLVQIKHRPQTRLYHFPFLLEIEFLPHHYT